MSHKCIGWNRERAAGTTKLFVLFGKCVSGNLLQKQFRQSGTRETTSEWPAGRALVHSPPELGVSVLTHHYQSAVRWGCVRTTCCRNFVAPPPAFQGLHWRFRCCQTHSFGTQCLTPQEYCAWLPKNSQSVSPCDHICMIEISNVYQSSSSMCKVLAFLYKVSVLPYKREHFVKKRNQMLLKRRQSDRKPS